MCKKLFCCFFPSIDDKKTEESRERDPLLGKQSQLESPLGENERATSDGSEFYGSNQSRSGAATPEVIIKPSSKEKSAEKKSKEKSVPKSSTKPKGEDATEEEKSKVLEFKKFDIPELDCIFSDFKTTFDPFVQNRQDLEKSEDSFKRAVKSFAEIHPEASIREYIAALNGKLKAEGIKVKLKEGVLTIYNEGAATVRGISDAVSTLNTILKTGKDLKQMPLTIEEGSTDAVERAEDLDVPEILKREFKNVWNFGKIPKLKKAFSNNIEQIRRAPKMVRDFYRTTKKIILEIYEAFADEEDKKKMKEEMAAENDNEEEMTDEKQGGNKKTAKGANEKNKAKKKEKDEFHEKLKFEPVGIADIDSVFISLASAINPFVETREGLQAARESFENVVMTICNFDEKKELRDYLRELKKDAKAGKITIYIDESDGVIKVKAIEGVKPPKLYRDAVQALNDLQTSGKEALELEPHVQHGAEECFNRIKQIDPASDFHTLLKKKTDVFTLPSKIKKFNDNRKLVQEIPGVVKEFCSYVKGLLQEILETLAGENTFDPKKNEQDDSSKDSDEEGENGDDENEEKSDSEKDQEEDQDSEEEDINKDEN
ncbi:eukaryotic translation initiation factor 5B-like [Montipora capricornis]|uniref:eukaryotic translation initiation factor 5B-like n=1 Tax=Montipora foliosa TaxID=591990 RepID=UPI0035F13072